MGGWQRKQKLTSTSVAMRGAALREKPSITDPRIPVTQHPLFDAESTTVNVPFGNDVWHKYPTVWLRDNCRCPSCFHPVSRNRTILMRDLDLNARPRKCQIDSSGEQLLIEW